MAKTAPKTIASHKVLKVGDIVDVWDNEIDDVRRARVIDVGNSFPAVIVELFATEYEEEQRVGMQQGPYTDGGRFRIVAVVPKQPAPLVDNATSHLNNALQVSVMLAAEIPRMIGNPGYQEQAAKALAAIDDRIRSALVFVKAMEKGVGELRELRASLEKRL